MTQDTRLGRRGFLKNAAATGLAGVVGVTTLTGQASAVGDYLCRIGSYDGIFQYNIKGYNGTNFSMGPVAEDGDVDSVDDSLIVGEVGEGHYDNYYHDGRIDSMLFLGVTDSIHFRFPADANEIEVSDEGGSASWSYSIYASGDISPGRQTEGNDYINSNGGAFGVVDGGTDYWDYTGTIQYISVSGPVFTGSFDKFQNLQH